MSAALRNDARLVDSVHEAFIYMWNRYSRISNGRKISNTFVLEGSSQNHKIVESEKDRWRCSSSTLYSKQGQLEEVAQGHA